MRGSCRREGWARAEAGRTMPRAHSWLLGRWRRALAWRRDSPGDQMLLDGLGKRELFTGCEVVQDRGRARGQPPSARLVAGIAPGRADHRVQLLPLRRIQAPVTPLLTLLASSYPEETKAAKGET